MKALWPLVAVFAAALSPVRAPARDKPEEWIRIRSQHFIVATNSNEKQGRRIADQFERMRSVFHAEFPKMRVDPGSPIIVIAVKNQKDFQALEPAAYLGKGKLELAGLFLRAPDKNYVLMRLDAGGEHPYEIVYHEYTHLLLSKFEWIPLWLNEGLAEFYQNTDIEDKEALLGQPSGYNITLLRQKSLLPLETLFAVDEKSPYYHEEDKGTIFYAESWALTHYLETSDFKDKNQRLAHYLEMTGDHVDPVTAASRAFGDLKQLQATLQKYVAGYTFPYFKMMTTTEVDQSAFKMEAMAPVQADALRADLLAYNDRPADARALIDRVLQEDPNNALAHETLGLMEFRQGHLEEAKKYYAQAVQADSQSYLAHYYFATITMTESLDGSNDGQIENSLRTSIKLNPEFAPSFDRLAVFLAMRHRNLDEARMMGLTAVSLDPANVGYRINLGNVFLQKQDSEDAIKVLQGAAKIAKTPQDSQMVDNILMRVREYAAEQQRVAENAKRTAIGTIVAGDSAGPVPADGSRATSREVFVANGPHRFVTGVLKEIHCDTPAIDLKLDAAGKIVALYSENYFKIQYSALNFKPEGDLNPCKDLQGRTAKVEYVESATQGQTPRVLAIEVRK